jgi:DNA-binding NtrC family response regulator
MSRVLLIEQDQTTRGILSDVLRTEGYQLTATPGMGNATEQVVCEDYALVIADISADYLAGIEFVQAIKEEKTAAAIILISGDDQDVDWLSQDDVFAHLTKPLKMDELLAHVQRALDYNQQAVQALQTVRIDVETDYQFKDIVAESDAMLRVSDMISRVAATHVFVLITGEPGSGRRLVARAIHDNGPRRDKGYLAVDCSVEPAAKLEAALFGQGDKPGSLELAREGTMLMMGVEKLPIPVQTKLLEVFRSKTFSRIDSKKKIDLDVRIMATSAGTLDTEVQAGTFNPDLSKLLNALAIVVPPLREHKEDINALISRTLRREVGDGGQLPILESSAETVLQNFPWPGNVAQLEDTVRSAARAAKGGTITMDCLKPFLSAQG